MDIQIVGLVAAYLVAEIAKVALKQKQIKTNAETPPIVSLNEKQSRYLRDLYEMHLVKDSTGRPIWYNSEQLMSQQDKIITILNDMSKTQNDTTHVLERIIDKLDSIPK